jgi:hypothetical protein
MKYLLLILTFQVCVFHAEPDYRDVSSIRELILPYSDNLPDSSKAYLSSSHSYSKGLLTSIKEWTENGILLRNETFTYDSLGRLFKSVKIAGQTLHIYNSKGELAEIRDIDEIDGKQKISRKTWSYDAFGNVAEEKFFGPGGEITWWSVSDFDGKKLVRRRGFRSNMTPYWTEEYHYDSKNRKTRIDYLDNTGVIFRQEGWSYDANGDTTVHEEYDAEGSITLRMLMTYYTKGKINSAKSYDVAGNPQLTSQYDKYGNLTEEVIYDVDGSALQSISREYNKENIKIREITKFRGKIISEKYFRVENRIKDKK